MGDEKDVKSVSSFVDGLHAFFQGDISNDWWRIPEVNSSIRFMIGDPYPMRILASSQHSMSFLEPLFDLQYSLPIRVLSLPTTAHNLPMWVDVQWLPWLDPRMLTYPCLS